MNRKAPASKRVWEMSLAEYHAANPIPPNSGAAFYDDVYRLQQTWTWQGAVVDALAAAEPQEGLPRPGRRVSGLLPGRCAGLIWSVRNLSHDAPKGRQYAVAGLGMTERQQAIRRAIEAGTYGTEIQLDLAIDRLLEDLLTPAPADEDREKEDNR